MIFMILKVFFLITIVHCGLISKHDFLNGDDTINLHQKLVELTYDTRPRLFKRSSGEDVGKPLILTPFIENNKISEARAAARVNDTFLLPGIESYAGYLTVDKKFNGNLWFWYFPVANKSVEETPFIIWLQGGPGASSLFGLFTEIGPFSVCDNMTLRENEYSWGKNHSLLFIDNPVGTGFSFTDIGGYTENQTTIGEHLYSALQQFLTIFPELRTAPLYLTGESYAGKHVPSLGIQIHRHKNTDEKINLQGLAIGNGFIDPVTIQHFSSFFREVGLVDDETADYMKAIEYNTTRLIKDGDMAFAFLSLSKTMSTIKSSAGLPNIYNYLSDTRDGIEFSRFSDFVQRPELRRALHVGNTTFSSLQMVYLNLIMDFLNSAKPWLEELLNHYKVLLYSGHLDTVVPYPASINTYKSLKFLGAEQYRKAERIRWFHNGKLAGYIKRGGYLTEVMVRGAGHMVPKDQPAAALALITAFVGNNPL